MATLQISQIDPAAVIKAREFVTRYDEAKSRADHKNRWEDFGGKNNSQLKIEYRKANMLLAANSAIMFATDQAQDADSLEALERHLLNVSTGEMKTKLGVPDAIKKLSYDLLPKELKHCVSRQVWAAAKARMQSLSQ